MTPTISNTNRHENPTRRTTVKNRNGMMVSANNVTKWPNT
jgi:hypothetical protein|nr:MAG TPA_asm: hypothetical protein [Caudoviricetes sp.]